MKLIITQPNYLPWLGYFAQLQSCDKWIVLDNVQYNRREWQNRNRIINNRGDIEFLTVNTKKSPRNTLIKDIQISETFDVADHINKLKSNYRQANYFDETIEIIESSLLAALNLSKNSLSKFNVNLIKSVCEHLNVKIKYEYASDIELTLHEQTPSEKLLALLLHNRADIYLSSKGSQGYMESELFKFEDKNIKVLWQNFNHHPYAQINTKTGFVSHMSFVDYLFNCGKKRFCSYIRCCHQEIL